jgi:hypothetical protein
MQNAQYGVPMANTEGVTKGAIPHSAFGIPH